MKLLNEQMRHLNRLTQSFSLNDDFDKRVMNAISDGPKNAGVSEGKILGFLMEFGKSEKAFGREELPVKKEFSRILRILGIQMTLRDLKKTLLEMKEGSIQQFELSDKALEAVVGGVSDHIDLLKMRDRAVEVLERLGSSGGKGSD